MSDLQIPGWNLLRRGSLAEVYASGDRVLWVATDRMAVEGGGFSDTIPGKGKVRAQLTAFWLRKFDFAPSHFLTADFAAFPAELKPLEALLSGRTMLCRRAQPLPVEAVVRGYLAGAAWEEYRECGSVDGVRLPGGLPEAVKLPQPLFTAVARETEVGGQPVPWDQCRRLLGDETAHRIREQSLEVYEHGRVHAERAGILIAGSRFRFGVLEEIPVLLGECLTPDSSRFWVAKDWKPGVCPPDFERQFVEEWLRQPGRDCLSPTPRLPVEVIERTAARYHEAYERLALGRWPT